MHKEEQKNSKKKWILLIALLIIIIILLLLFRERWVTEKVGQLDFRHYEKGIELNERRYKYTYKFSVTSKEDDEQTYIAAIMQQKENAAIYNNENIRISVEKNGKYIIGSKDQGALLSTLDRFEENKNTGYSNIAYGTVKKGEKDNYKITIYLDEKAERDNNHSYELEVKIYEAGENVKPAKIILDLGDGKGPQEISVNQNGKYDNLPTPEKDGYKFKGWYTEDGKQVTSKDYVNAIDSEKLHAEYEAEQYRVTIDANGGEYAGSTSLIKEYEDETTLETPTRIGYTFTGWTVNGKARIKGNTLSKVASNVTVKAEWKANEYKLTVKADNGLFSTKTYKVKYEEVKQIEVPSKKGYTFKGWAIEGKGTLNGNTVKIGTGDVTLTAKWQINVYTVKFDVNGGAEQIAERKIQYNEKVGQLIIPTKKGYTFEGWYSENKKVTENTRVEDNMNLVAKYKANVYELTINPNGGTWAEKQTEQKLKVEYDTTKEIENPTRTGYTFMGWTVSSNDAKLTNKTFAIGAEDCTLTANWKVNTYRVEYNVNGGNETYEAINRDYDTELGELPQPTKKGYTFEGWYNGNQKVESTTLVKDNTTLVANYTINEYTLVIEPTGGLYNGKEESTEYKLKYQEKIELQEPTREDYLFMGWEIDSEDATLDGNSLVIGAEDVTIFAKWLKDDFSYVVKHYQQSLDGNTYALVDTDTFNGLKKGTVITAATKNYAGFTKPENKKITIDIDNQNNIVEYKYDRKSYNLTIDPNTGIYDDKTENTVINDIKFGATVDLKTPSKIGYTHLKWNIQGENTEITGNTSLKMGSENTVITAQWEANKYVVSFNGNTGVANGDDIEVTYDSTYGTLPVGIKAGYTFLGWFTEAEGGQEVKSTDTVKITENTTLYAHWEINKQNLTINPNGGTYEGETSNTIKRIEFDGTCTIEVPVREGYTFKGWKLTGNGTMSTLVSQATFTMKTEDCTLEAQWEANEYMLTLNPNGGELETTEKEVTYDQKYGAFATPTRLGYTFEGWYTEAEGGNKIEATDIVKITENKEIFAHWKGIVSNVTINPNGGMWNNTEETQEFEMEYSTTKEIPVPTREGYTFVKWTLSGANASMTTITNDAVFTMGTEDATLTAEWKINTYVITIDANGGTINETTIVKQYHETLETIAEPTKNGYTFMGWYEDLNDEDTKVELSTKVTKDMTIIAKWSANPVDLVIDYNDGTTETRTINSEFDAINKVEVPRREGYTFKGWKQTEGNSQVNTSLTEETVVIMGTEKTTVTAQWEANKYTLTLESNGGTLTETIKEVTYDEAYGTLETPVKKGYTFKGWYTSQAYETEITETTIVKQTVNHTIFAKWEVNKYTLNINYNGGEGEETTREVTYNESIGTVPVTSKKGNTFLGWYIDDTIITDGYIYKFDSDKELTAKWEANKYDLSIDPNGGTYAGSVAVTKSLVTYGTEKTLEKPTRVGYSFDGWEITGDATISENILTMGAENTTIKAKWKIVTGKLTINYNDDGTTENKVYDDLAYLDTKEIPDPTREGYEFTGWLLEGENARLDATIFTMGTKDATLTATWVPNTYTYIVKHYKQTVDGTGYTLVDADTEEDESLFGTKVTPETKQYEGFTAPEKITKTITTTDNLIEYKYARNKHKLTINPNGGEYKGSQETVEEELYYDELTSIAIPSKEGHTFVNWTVTGGTLIDNGIKMGDEDITLTANYIPNVYMLIYNANGGGIPFGGKVVTYGEKIGELPSPTKAGYTFKGWYLNVDDESTKVEETDTVTFTSHTILNAKWEKCDYRVVIDANNGLWNDQGYAAIGSSVGAEIDIPVPTRKGYTFTGWTLEGEGTMSSLISNAKFTGGEGNATLTANWVQNKYTLYYNTNGGTVTPLTETITFDEKYGTLAIPTKNGYTFDGWYTELEGGTLVTGEEVLTEENNIYVFAHWTKNSYELTVKPNGGNWEDNGTIYTEEQKYVLEYEENKEIKAPTRTGYRFNTWKFEGSLNGSSLAPMVTDGTFTMGYSNISIKADWIANEYTVIFDANGGTTTQGNKQVTYDQTYGELPIASKDGYTFAGWYTAKEGGEQVQADNIVKITSAQTLYARYTANEYTVTYVLNGGQSAESTKTITYNSEYGSLEQPTKQGYTFSGWYLEEELTTKVTENTIVTTIGDHNLYAGYKANKYQITFDPIDGEVDPTTTTVTYDKEYGVLPTPTYLDFIFDGWYTAKEGGEKVVSSDIVKITSDTTLYAHYRSKSVTISFNSNGGGDFESIERIPGGQYGELPAPTIAGKTFEGWYLEPEFVNKITSGMAIQITTDHVLYANYKENPKYTVYFNSMSGTSQSAITVQNGLTYGTLPTPTRTNGKFLGWYTSTSYTNKVNSEDIVNLSGNQTLYAKWLGISSISVTYRGSNYVNVTVYPMVSGTYTYRYGSYTSTSSSFQINTSKFSSGSYVYFNLESATDGTSPTVSRQFVVESKSLAISTASNFEGSSGNSIVSSATIGSTKLSPHSGSKMLKVTSNTQVPKSQSISTLKTHKMYISMYYAGNFGVFLRTVSSHTTLYDFNNYSNQVTSWTRHSFIFVNQYNVADMLAYGKSTKLPGYVDDIIVIDLTETFGAGNEPDKSFMDNNITSATQTSINRANLR